jgi:hypothetical protein
MAAMEAPSRSDLANVAVGFNPRRESLRDALIAWRRLNRRARQGVASVVATRLVPIPAIDLRGFKPTATINSRYAAKTHPVAASHKTLVIPGMAIG